MTEATKIKDIQRTWCLVDAEGKILGRLATEIAEKLMGKAKPYFVRNLDCGDYVVVVNASKVKVTGKKEQKNEYFTYSGYPGGLRRQTLGVLRNRKPEYILQHAVKGMLPQNKLRDTMLKRLFVFAQEKHTFEDKFK